MSEYLNVDELAELLRMNRATIYRLAATRDIPGFKVGRHWRFRRDTIDSWIARQEGGEIAVPNTDVQCVLCQRRIPEALQSASICSADGCKRPVCEVCSSVKGRTACLEHSKPAGTAQSELLKPGSTEGLAASSSKLIWFRARETGFLARFDAVIRQSDVLRDRSGKELAKVASWDKIHKSTNDLALIKKLPGCRLSTRALVEGYPLNAGSRYDIKLASRVKIGPHNRLQLEARVLVNQEGLFGPADIEAPVTYELFSGLINRIRSESAGKMAFLLVGIYAPSGWTPDVIEMITGTESSKSTRFEFGAVCLVGPDIGDLYWDESDRRIASLVGIFKGETIYEEAEAYLGVIRDKLVLANSLELRALATDLGEQIEVVSEACRRLADEEVDLEIRKVKKVGTVIRWKK